MPLEVAAPLDYKRLNGLNLSLSGDHQFINAGLAISLCKCWLQVTGNWKKLLENVSEILMLMIILHSAHFFLLLNLGLTSEVG